MSDRTPALHAELARVLPPEDGAQWRWELAVTPVSRWRMARILLADAAHDGLVSVSEWLGRRRSRLAHVAQDVTVGAEIRLATFIHARRDGVRLAVADEQAGILDPELTEED